ncbi:high affinity cAMP-specific and IBMX-insensitive 3',5'-cyclic phosphodiesterase 8 isoform X2 [Anabrus simplex]|uniref:high affinity cAMP-specific and IBMX-insensitive 3',5'-cyclic phosphodiesterase 8 isoform X2 n=1 Tax=Anabrus simplex TaxID=316456 RepID=UPI0034DCCDA0
MGCTPSTIQHHGSHQYHAAEDIMKTRDQPQHARVAASTGSSSSPRSWRFRKGAAEKDKAVQPVPRPSLPQRTSQDLRLANLLKGRSLTPLKVLLVFPKDDFQSDALWSAAEKLGFESCMVRTRETVLETFTAKAHDVIIIDNRHPKTLDGEALCRSLRALKSSQFTVILAVVKRSFAEKDEHSVLNIINAGYNRWLVETSSLAMCTNELLQVESNDVLPRQQLAASQAFYLAVDKSKDLIHITDCNQKIQYVNRSSERVLGYSAKELLGKPVQDITRVENRELMLQSLQKGHEWEGTASCTRKVGDTVLLSCRVVPNLQGRVPTHFVFIHEFTGVVSKRGSDSGPPVPRELFQTQRGSIHTVRRGSADMRSVCSDGIRRQSMSKLHNLSIEAPITKVITLITSAQENSTPEVAAVLEKVVDILRTTELYSPVMKEDKVRTGDAVTSDLIAALLSQGGQAPLSVTRRSSNDSSVSRTAQSQTTGSRTFSRGNPTVSSQVAKLLDSSLLWEFDIFRLEQLTAKRPLVYLGMNLMLHFEVPQTLGCDESTLHNWLTIIELNYKSTNTYHNSTHAADVLQASAGFLERERLKKIMAPLDDATCLIAAAAHDVDHPGKSSAFLINSDDELALLYNDICVLESHHAALAFKLTVSDDRVNIFKGLERDVYKVARQNVIDMILATEMTRHFEHLAKFVNVFSKSMVRDDDPNMEVGSDLQEGYSLTQENACLVKRMLIKCADVSNPARPLKMCVEWANRIAEEYFNQTDEEKANNLPVVMPMFDRNTCSIPKSQIGFMDFIINDMFEAWEDFVEMPELMTNLEANYRFWKEMEAQGVFRIRAQDLPASQDDTLMESES